MKTIKQKINEMKNKQNQVKIERKIEMKRENEIETSINNVSEV